MVLLFFRNFPFWLLVMLTRDSLFKSKIYESMNMGVFMIRKCKIRLKITRLNSICVNFISIYSVIWFFTFVLRKGFEKMNWFFVY